MDTINPKLLDALKSAAKRGVRFEEAKESLLKSGWSEAEVMEATEQVSYDVLATSDDGVGPMSQADKEVAVVIGKAEINDQRIRSRDQAIADAAASEYAPDIQSRLYSESSFMDSIGIPWYVWLVLLPGLLIGVSVLRLTIWVSLAIWVLFICYIGYSFYQRFRKRP